MTEAVMDSSRMVSDALSNALGKALADNWPMWLLLGAMYVAVLVLKAVTKSAKSRRGRRGRSTRRRSGSEGPTSELVRLVAGFLILGGLALALVPPLRLAALHLLGWMGIAALGLLAVGMAVYALWPESGLAIRSTTRHGAKNPPSGLRIVPRSPAYRDAGHRPPNRRADYIAAKHIGDAGERSVSIVLKAAGLPTISDLVLPVGGGTAQIDHVVLAGHTLVCLETKNWSGMVFGDPYDLHWTVVDLSGEKHRPQNPLSQNRRHVTALRRRFPDADVRSFVVMAGKARFREQPAQVLRLGELRSRLADIASGSKADGRLLEGWKELERHRASAAHRRDAAAHEAFMRVRNEAPGMPS